MIRIYKLLLLLGAVGLFIITYLVYYFSRDLPNYRKLSNYNPPSVTRIYSSDGVLLEEYSKEYRVFIPVNSIPKSVIDAFISAEDKNFYSHKGLDLFSIVNAAFKNVSNILRGKRVQGGSTITQQVVKNFLLSSEVSLSRKIKEAILSLMVSYAFTKDQILELYLNQIFLGKNSYGVAAAALNYFDKSVEELNLQEAAFLAALPKAPGAFNPEKNYDRVKARRDYVITRMLEDGCISEESAKIAMASPIVLKKRQRNEFASGGYYTEQVRQEIINKVGKDYFYEGGLTIITNMDTKMQTMAEKALVDGIRQYDRRNGFKGALDNIELDNWKEKLEKFQEPNAMLNYKTAVVLGFKDTDTLIGLKDGSKSSIKLDEVKWAKWGVTKPTQVLHQGDIIIVEKLKAGYGLRQIPKVNGAILVMHPVTGRVFAMVGGYNYLDSKFNRATQALRQPGSTFKPFVYLAGLENGFTPSTIFNDAPIVIEQGPGLPAWRPKNDKHEYLGKIPMRLGLEKSRNMVTIRIAQAVGINKVVEITKRFGINPNPPKYYSSVLGAIETTLDKVTTAFAMMSNGGKKIRPEYIEMIKDRNGNIIYRKDARTCEGCNITEDIEGDYSVPYITERINKQVTDERSAYQIRSLLLGTVERGTGRGAKSLGKIIGGKTGTTNDAMDGWFIGFTSDLVVGTYMGYDTPKSLGKHAYGANTALPIFVNFMTEALQNHTPPPFAPPPEGISLVKVDPLTGLPSDKVDAVLDAFKAGTEPANVVRVPEGSNAPAGNNEIY